MDALSARFADRIREECTLLRSTLDPERPLPLESLNELVPLDSFTTGDDSLAEVRELAPTPVEFTVAHALGMIEDCCDDLSEHIASEVSAAVSLLIRSAAERSAVLSRIAQRWPWLEALDTRTELSVAMSLLVALHRIRLTDGSGKAKVADEWPTDVALKDAADWIAERLEEHSGLGAMYRAACYGDIAIRRRSDAAPTPLKEEHLRIAGTPWAPKPTTLFIPKPHDFCISGEQFAWIYSAHRAVEADRAKSTIRMPANRYAQVAARMLGTTEKKMKGRSNAKLQNSHAHPLLKEPRIVIDWDGRKEPVQLHLLGDGAETIDETVAHSILSTLGGDALRDWIVLHQMAGEQGATGDFEWAWEEHKKKSDYASRIRKSTRSEAELLKATRQRLFRLHRAELWKELEFVENGEKKTYRERIGPHGLISISAEIHKNDADCSTEVISGKINPALYSLGPKKRGAFYTQLPSNIGELPEAELRVFLQLAYCWRSGSGDARGIAGLKAKTLWQYAGFSDDQIKDKRRWPRLRNQLERVLAALAKSHGVVWSIEGEGAFAKYTVHAPHWWTDRVVHGVKPQAVLSTAHVPRTAAELEETRKARGLSMRHIADAVGVNVSTISRLAQKPSATLPPEWLNKLAALKLYRE